MTQSYIYLNYSKQNILKHYIFYLTLSPKPGLCSPCLYLLPTGHQIILWRKFPSFQILLSQLSYSTYSFFYSLTAAYYLGQLSFLTDSSCLNLFFAYSEPSSLWTPENADLRLSLYCLQTFTGSFHLQDPTFLGWPKKTWLPSGPNSSFHASCVKLCSVLLLSWTHHTFFMTLAFAQPIRFMGHHSSSSIFPLAFTFCKAFLDRSKQSWLFLLL